LRRNGGTTAPAADSGADIGEGVAPAPVAAGSKSLVI
jgi:hypothetical protein